MARAREAGVDRFVAVGGSDSLNTRALEAAARFPRNVVAAVGLDREQARLSVGQLESAMRRTAAFFEPDAGQPRPVAVGETGLDFHYGADTRERQLDLFRQHLALARRVCLPVIVHSREAESETLAALSDRHVQQKVLSDLFDHATQLSGLVDTQVRHNQLAGILDELGRFNPIGR